MLTAFTLMIVSVVLILIATAFTMPFVATLSVVIGLSGTTTAILSLRE